MRSGARLAVIALLALAIGCAPKRVPAPIVTTPQYPDFVMPAIPPESLGSRAADSADEGWRFLQAGDLKSADRAVAAALKADSQFYPAETTAGYVALARKDSKAALSHFDRALTLRPAYLSALVGRGHTLLAMNRDRDAIEAFSRALDVDPGMADLRRRIDVLKFRGVEQDLVDAREAAKSGKLDEALRAYQQALAATPDSAFLYREIGVVEIQKGSADGALQSFQKAVSLDPTDATSFAHIGDLLGERGDVPGALDAFERALAIEPSDEVTAKRDAMRARLELARLPAEYRAMASAAQVTRADIAALIGVALAPVLRTTLSRDAVVITDVRNNWAENWIMTVTRAGVMEAFSNHTFQPRTIVRRADFAQILSRLIGDVGRTPAAGAERIRFSDLPPGHLAYAAAATAVAAGVMSPGPEGAFQPSRMVTGPEAIESIGRLRELANLGSTAGVWRP